jgi:hypothetical protein
MTVKVPLSGRVGVLREVISETIKPKKKSKLTSSASPAGIHFIQSYKQCNRWWMFKFKYGLTPLLTSVALLDGAAFHLGKETWYKSKGDGKKAVANYKRYMEENYTDADDQELMRVRYKKSQVLLNLWFDKFGEHDLSAYKVLMIEKPFELALPQKDYIFTGRIDLGLMPKDKSYITLLDTKRTGFSVRETNIAFTLGDQITGYTWAAQALFPQYKVPIVGLADIAYWNDKSNDQGNIELFRTEEIERTPEAIEDFKQYTVNAFIELAQKLKYCGNDVKKLYSVFGRTTAWCSAFFRRCDYANICMKHIKVGEKVPGFKHVELDYLPKKKI